MDKNKKKTIVETLRQFSADYSQQLLYTFFENQTETSLTYGELDHQARLIAAHIGNHAAQGERQIAWPAG